jgi:hypothetical protein
MERPIELYHNSSYTSFGGGSASVSLVTGEFTKVLEFLVPERMALLLKKNPKVIMKLKNSSGTELNASAKIKLAIKKPGEELATSLGAAKIYAPYAHLTLAGQNNVENDASVRFNLDREGSILEYSRLQVLVNSASAFTLSWADSELYIRDVSEVDL